MSKKWLFVAVRCSKCLKSNLRIANQPGWGSQQLHRSTQSHGSFQCHFYARMVLKTHRRLKLSKRESTNQMVGMSGVWFAQHSKRIHSGANELPQKVEWQHESKSFPCLDPSASLFIASCCHVNVAFRQLLRQPQSLCIGFAGTWKILPRWVALAMKSYEFRGLGCSKGA